MFQIMQGGGGAGSVTILIFIEILLFRISILIFCELLHEVTSS